MIASKYLEIAVMLVAVVVALYVGSHVVMLSTPELSIIVALIGIAAWTLSAGDYWWTPVLFGATILGVFKVGVKIYPIEVSLLLAMLGLAPMIFTRNKHVFQAQRGPLPFIFYLTALYLTVRFMIDILPAAGFRGNLGRIYFGAIWPFIFGFLFHHYGKLSVTKFAFGSLFVVLTLRCLLSVVGYLTGIALYIPGINYVLSFSDADSLIAMRAVALNLMLVCLVFFHCTRAYFFKFIFLVIMVCGAILVVMSQGRFATFLALTLPMIFFAWSRLWIPVAVTLCCGVMLILAINVFPDSLDNLPPFAQRSLSALIVTTQSLDIKAATKGSDEWHDALRVEGFRRWTENPVTILFGYGIRPSPDLYDMKSFSVDPQTIVGISADVGAYECALWTVLALVGAVGFILLTMLFLSLGKEIYRRFLQRPSEGTFWEGLLFWAGYSSVAWYVVLDFQGGFPNFELMMMLLVRDILQEGKIGLKEINVPPAPVRRPIPSPV